MLINVNCGRLALARVLVENVATKVEYHVCHGGSLGVVVECRSRSAVGGRVGKVSEKEGDRISREDGVVRRRKGEDWRARGLI